MGASPRSRAAGSRPAYEYRLFAPGDASGFLDLYETVWGRPRDRDWFRWRFEENPYVDEVPMVVADLDGEIVGAEPCLAFRLRAGSEEVLAFQPADWLVHPDHRRRGVFSSMTELLLDQYDADGPALYFNFPSEALVPGLRKFDWRLTERPATYYRVQNPGRLAVETYGSSTDLRAVAARRLGRLATPLARGYYRARARLSPPVSGLSVDRYESIPVDLLTAFYDRSVPREIHVVRDAAFYRWRFANPRWETATYVARRDGEVVATCVAATETNEGVRRTSLLDVLPWHGGDAQAFRALLGGVVADAADVDYLRVGTGAVPPAILREFGFLAPDSRLLSGLSRSAPLAVRPASVPAAESWALGGCDPADGGQWSLALADQDIA